MTQVGYQVSTSYNILLSISALKINLYSIPSDICYHFLLENSVSFLREKEIGTGGIGTDTIADGSLFLLVCCLGSLWFS